MPKFPKFYGMTTVGERGQVVIPKQARKLLNIKSGDKLIVTSGPQGKKIVNFIPADDFAQEISPKD
ncbi:MAG: AbrB/MazE/SpoVT family DNA-binding domain-containing protein [Candidatus Omnitrophica bacterium]|nr:AbrB/MazE/SpoVT family DNA-binding domain-containing protein [Candidatus Omnitrophota bacterium]